MIYCVTKKLHYSCIIIIQFKIVLVIFPYCLKNKYLYFCLTFQNKSYVCHASRMKMNAEFATTPNNDSPGRELSVIDRACTSAVVGSVTRECRYCHNPKVLLDFGRSTSKYQCNTCFEAMYKAQYKKNRAKVLKKRKEYRALNIDVLLKKGIEYYAENKERLKEYRITNKKTIAKRNKRYYEIRSKNDILFRLARNLRGRVYGAIIGGKKSAKTMDLIGCTIDFIHSYLESQFDDKMTWDNYGTYWHIDHILPCASFNLLDPEEQKMCFNWRNLQPLEGKENMSKGAKILIKYIKP